MRIYMLAYIMPNKNLTSTTITITPTTAEIIAHIISYNTPNEYKCHRYTIVQKKRNNAR